MKRLLTVSVLVLVALAVAASAWAARGPTALEKIQLRQATYDYYFTNDAISRAVVTRIRVVPLAHPAALRSRLVTKYATITLRGFDISGQDVGFVVAVAVYYSSPSPGWRVFSDGSSDVGCTDKWYPVGMRRAIMRSLALTCTR
jgi:hypothetical protein